MNYKQGHTASIATRAATLIGRICRNAPGRAVPLNIDALAFTLGCSRNYLANMTMRMRTRSWAFQGYGFMLFIRYRKHKTARCGHPQIYAIHRHWCHAIGGAGSAAVRWHLRKRSIEAWDDYLQILRNLAFSLPRRITPADHTYKGIAQMEDKKIQTANRPRLRGNYQRADAITSKFRNLHPALDVNLRGWAANRFAEGHDAAKMMDALGVAMCHLYRRDDPDLNAVPWRPANAPGWVCEVARRHLEYDGLTPNVRAWERRRKARKAFAQNEQRPGRKPGTPEVQRPPMEIRILPNGAKIYFDRQAHAWKDVL